MAAVFVTSPVQGAGFGNQPTPSSVAYAAGTSDSMIAAEVQQPGADEYISGEILVGFHLASAKAVEVARAALGASVMERFSQIGVQRWKLPPSISTMSAISMLSVDPNIMYVEPNYVVHATVLPNDPRRNDLWGLHNIGQKGGTFDADVDAVEAWDVETGSSNIVVGVIDSGIDYNHEDLVGNIWINPGEDLDHNGIVDQTDFDGIDNDGNGYVDDLRGWDCVNDDNNPIDDNNHGTHVSGTIGGRGNNGIGVVGVNWNMKLMPLKFLNAGGSGSNADAIECINYAAWFKDGSGNNVVRITSNSWGGGSKSSVLETAIANSGALFVAAAGNSGNSRKFYPAAYTPANIIAVAATDANDALASFSNYGLDWVDLAAPGVDIWSSVRNNGYASFEGTSMATPHVSGACALVITHFPSKTNAEVKAAIMDSVDPKASLMGKMVTGGRLNVARAVGGTPDPEDPDAPAAVSDLAADPSQTTANSVTLAWTATGDDGMTGTAYLYDVRYRPDTPITDADWATAIQAAGEPLPGPAGTPETFTVSQLQPSTMYYLALKVVDDAGNPSDLSNVASETTATPPPGSWSLFTVDTEGDVGRYTSIALDRNGLTRIAYYDSTNARLKYASWTGTEWTFQVVDTGNWGWYPSLALDTAGNPHIAYGYASNVVGKLRYAKWTGSSWSIEEVDQAAKGVGHYTSLVLDPSGKPRISYNQYWGKDAVRYAEWTGTKWTLQQVDLGGGDGTSVALDSAGNPMVCYGSNGLLKLASRVGTTWTTQIVDPTGGGQCSLKTDARGKPHISYVRLSTELRYASWTGTSWVLELVDSASTGCSFADSYSPTSLALDASAKAHISAREGCPSPNPAHLKYAHWTGSEWVAEFVDLNGRWSSIGTAGAAEVTVHISYYGGDSDLKYATRTL